MAYDPKELQTIVEAAAPPDLDVTFRAMFGGILAYAEGKPFVSLSDVGLAVKLAGVDHTELMAVSGAKALQYDESQPVSKTYVVVPESMLKDKDTLRGWLKRSATNLPAKKPKKAKKA